MAPPPDPDRLISIVLVGKVGCGKSASGNTILGREAFRTSCGFSAATRTCERVCGNVCGRRIAVVDTPGLDCAEVSLYELCASLREMTDNIVFLLVIELGRFTEEQRAAVRKMEDIFGESVRERTVILFTYGDALNTSIEDFICRAGAPLGQVVRNYGGRFHVFNNESEHRSQVTELFQKMELVRQNTNDMFSSVLLRDLRSRELQRRSEERERRREKSEERKRRRQERQRLVEKIQRRSEERSEGRARRREERERERTSGMERAEGRIQRRGEGGTRHGHTT